jgi:hypothetical protein
MGYIVPILEGPIPTQSQLQYDTPHYYCDNQLITSIIAIPGARCITTHCFHTTMETCRTTALTPKHIIIINHSISHPLSSQRSVLQIIRIISGELSCLSTV